MKQFKPYAAEFLGTLILALVAMISPNPLAVGFTLMILVYIFGGISGAHVNPLITVALMSFKKIKTLDGVYYIIAQVLGGLAGVGIISAIFVAHNQPFTWIQDGSTISTVGFVAELIAGFIFMMAVSTVALGKVPSVVSGLVVGGGLVLALSLAGGLTPGLDGVISNPAVAIATGNFNLDHLFAPLLGAVLGLGLYAWLSSDTQKAHN